MRTLAPLPLSDLRAGGAQCEAKGLSLLDWVTRARRRAPLQAGDLDWRGAHDPFVLFNLDPGALGVGPN